mmetsp:Transcript_11731/g.20148  ORF Transcript_11731/g.20148 Transcript_11731/m.20148 type:complete len:233 (-) Transcript_11731:2-700(-)
MACSRARSAASISSASSRLARHLRLCTASTAPCTRRSSAAKPPTRPVSCASAPATLSRQAVARSPKRCQASALGALGKLLSVSHEVDPRRGLDNRAAESRCGFRHALDWKDCEEDEVVLGNTGGGGTLNWRRREGQCSGASGSSLRLSKQTLASFPSADSDDNDVSSPNRDKGSCNGLPKSRSSSEIPAGAASVPVSQRSPPLGSASFLCNVSPSRAAGAETVDRGVSILST